VKVCKGCYKRGCDDCMAIISCEHDGCKLRLCSDCNFQSDLEHTLDACANCERVLCFKHRYEECKENCRSAATIANGCLGCFRIVSCVSILPGVMDPSLLQG
jgi:hypothetical protein